MTVPDLANLVPVRHLERHFPDFTKQYTEYLIRRNKADFAATCAIVIGGKTLVDLVAVQEWVEVNSRAPIGVTRKKQERVEEISEGAPQIVR